MNTTNMHPIIQTFHDCGMGSNAVCQSCRSESGVTTNALGPWLIAESPSEQQSVLFVGKVARGDCLGEEVGENLEDVRAFGRDFIRTSSWHYWSYTREIIEEVYGSLDAGFRCVSFTNIVKCNNESTPDTTHPAAKRRCISENRFIWHEVELLRPQRIIFYTNCDYDDFIDEFMPTYASKWRDNSDLSVDVGQKTMPWWDRSFFDNDDKEVLRFLRIGHPERKNKEDFVQLVSQWISSTT